MLCLSGSGFVGTCLAASVFRFYRKILTYYCPDPLPLPTVVTENPAASPQMEYAPNQSAVSNQKRRKTVENAGALTERH